MLTLPLIIGGTPSSGAKSEIGDSLMRLILALPFVLFEAPYAAIRPDLPWFFVSLTAFNVFNSFVSNMPKGGNKIPKIVAYIFIMVYENLTFTDPLPAPLQKSHASIGVLEAQAQKKVSVEAPLNFECSAALQQYGRVVLER